MSLSDKYIALYRQYRPKRFDEVKGQDHIVTTLKNIILNNKISHAYLFCGPHGNGKTSTAKIFANTINCDHKTDKLIPCDECIQSIDRNLDIIEIDAASNTGVDDIRELREKIKHLPSHSKYKIYIIDEVHMLSKGAFNALLKTLEEPPAHVIFILATTDPQKIPLTILSRVQRFNFKKMENAILENELKDIFIKEHIKATDEAIKMIAQLGAGSFRDTLSIADQISIYAGDNEITVDMIEKLFGIANTQNALDLLQVIYEHKLPGVLKIKQTLIDNGADIERLLNQLIAILKDLIVFAKTGDDSLLDEITKDQVRKMTISEDAAYEYLKILSEGLKEVKFSDMPQQAFELLLIKLTSAKVGNENYKHVIEMPKAVESNTNDFVIHNEITEPKKNSNNTELNSIFNLSNIANTFTEKQEQAEKAVKIERVNVEDVLQKTQEFLLEETENVLDANERTDEIVTSNFEDDNDFVMSSDFEDDDNITVEEFKVGNDHVDLDTVINCLLVRQHAKVKTKGFENADFTNQDVLHYALINAKLPKESADLIAILGNMKIIFSSKDFIMMTSDYDDKVIQLNRYAYREDVIRAAKSIFGRYVHLIGLTKEDITNASQYWKQNIDEIRKRQVKPFDDLSTKYDNEQKQSVEWAKDVFGDRFTEKK
ncbi:DNA polymerase III subunit gamma/tau [Metamycoplasma neophronis]|uniref:DNA polymerase III subunit gamma/tau n=1 Tax=Metamycoplasma neophronis TaxID=872983 RepID=UPI0014771982|nr:DNA polymerase III subunit gamma/tau [Metamycoplasma neophronis]